MLEDDITELDDIIELEVGGRLEVAGRLTDAVVDAVPTGPDTVAGLEVVAPGATGAELVVPGAAGPDWVTPGSDAVGEVTEAVAMPETRQTKEQKGNLW
jgi:hypothetical protein